MYSNKSAKTKYVFVTGGVASSLGKGIISSSLARLLLARGYSVAIQKMDPYINIDPGTLNPYEHGECYVTEDGVETDLDLGHYERFTSIPTSSANTVTTGKIYYSVINKERNGDYQGKTVQVIPHITDEIKRRIQLLGKSKKYDVVITEIGGTVGDIESLPYIEAARQLRYELGVQNTAFLHLTLIPYMAASGELKTKPTQHSVKQLLEYGVQPDVLVLRTEQPLGNDIRKKVALFCNVDQEAVVESVDVPTIYEVPLKMHAQRLDEVILQKLGLPIKESNLTEWRKFVERVKNSTKVIDIALVGKYVELPDAYKSISESFVHAGAVNDVKVKLHFVAAEKVTAESVQEMLGGMHGVLIGPGMGQRGVEGKMVACEFARTNNVPLLGICMGMQCAVIEFARNVLGYADADTKEHNPLTKHPVIDIMDSEKSGFERGETMRLGAFGCQLTKGSKIHSVYGEELISERHRHRYEFNNEYFDEFAAAGLRPVGVNPESGLVEAVELDGHPWYIAVQYHPEYKSNVEHPHPLFVNFVKAAIEFEGK
ncbi:MAG: CTP synthase [Tidjanibacter sp.]|nr:CTP synthase [Tidjanibacter sp.]